MDDLLKDYPAFRTYKRNGLDLELQFHKAEALPENVLDWAFTLCKSNMETFYNASWGWHDDTKRSELGCAEARFIIAYTKVSHLPALHRDAHASNLGSIVTPRCFRSNSPSSASSGGCPMLPLTSGKQWQRAASSAENESRRMSAGRDGEARACGLCAHAVGEGRHGGLARAVLLRHPAGALCAAQGPGQVCPSCSPSLSFNNDSQGA